MTVTQRARRAHPWTGLVMWFPVLCVSVALMAGVALAQSGRVVAIGDIHGAAGPLQALLMTTGLTDETGHWSGGSATLVQTGDFTDRGTGVKVVLDLLMRLEFEASAAGGRVVVLLGNHEAMNLMGILRDVNPELLASFETPQSEARRDANYDAYVAFMEDRATVLGSLLPDPLSQAEWMAAHPLGFFEYMEALGPDGTYGRWLLSKPVVARVGDSILLHGGLHPTASPADLSDLSETVRSEIETFYRYREELVDHGVILPFFTYREITTAVQQELGYWVQLVSPTGPPAPDGNVSLSRDERDFVSMLLDMGDMGSWAVIDIAQEGPLWFRGFSRWAEDEGLPHARSLTERYGVTRIIVGHTIPASRLITPRFGNRVFLIDTGMLVAHYSGRPSALEIDGSRVTAVYLDRRVPLVP